MGILRNSVDIVGITPENELPSEVIGQLVQYAEVEHIHVPEGNSSMGLLHQVTLNVDIKSSRVIKAPLSRIIVIDGEKQIKIIYSQRRHSERTSTLDLTLPYNTFIEVPNGSGDVENIDVYITDAYFHLIESRQIYGHILYMLDVHYKDLYKKPKPRRQAISSIDEAIKPDDNEPGIPVEIINNDNDMDE